MYNRSIDEIRIEIEIVIWPSRVVGRLGHVVLVRDGQDAHLIRVVCVQMVGELAPEHELVVFESHKTRYLQLVHEILVDLFVAHVMQLNAHEPRALASYQVAQVKLHLAVVPFLHEKCVGENEQNARAAAHDIFDVRSEHFVLAILRVVMQNEILNHILLVQERNELAFHPVGIRLIVTYEQIVFFLASHATLARTYRVKERYTVKDARE